MMKSPSQVLNSRQTHHNNLSLKDQKANSNSAPRNNNKANIIESSGSSKADHEGASITQLFNEFNQQ
jgi:hypothetical protein